MVEMQRIARHVLGRGDDVLAVGAKGHEFVGGYQALAYQGAGIAGLPLRVAVTMRFSAMVPERFSVRAS